MTIRKPASARVSRVFRLLLAGLLLASGPFPAPPAVAETSEEKPSISIQTLTIQPAEPTVDQLCRLTLLLENSGSEILSRLVFRVVVNGHELPTYRNQMFLTRIKPGATEPLHLYNFWTTESGRPAPTDGTLRVEVTLTEASWVKVETSEEGDAWHPIGPVSGLPISASATMPLRKNDAGT